jgi:hypothetical protein
MAYEFRILVEQDIDKAEPGFYIAVGHIAVGAQMAQTWPARLQMRIVDRSGDIATTMVGICASHPPLPNWGGWRAKPSKAITQV